LPPILINYQPPIFILSLKAQRKKYNELNELIAKTDDPKFTGINSKVGGLTTWGTSSYVDICHNCKIEND